MGVPLPFWGAHKRGASVLSSPKRDFQTPSPKEKIISPPQKGVFWFSPPPKRVVRLSHPGKKKSVVFILRGGSLSEKNPPRGSAPPPKGGASPL